MDSVYAADGQAAGGNFIFDDVGVASQEVGGGVAVKFHHQAVRVGAGVGYLVRAIHTFRDGYRLEHGGLAPAAVEAQHGDGMGHILQGAVGGGNGVHVDETFQVCAIFVRAVQGFFDVLGDGCAHLNGNGLPGLYDNLARLQGAEKQVGVIGGDGAVVVQIRRFADGVPETGGVVQNQLGVLGVGDSVTVQVAGQFGFGDEESTVHLIGDLQGQGHGLGVQVSDAGSF